MKLQTRFSDVVRPVVDCSVLPSRTEQHHKDECDINKLVKRFNKTGVISHLNKIEGIYGDVTGVTFQDALDLVHRSQSMFDALPSDIRNYFRNDPAELLTFMDDEANIPRGVELGLFPKEMLPEELAAPSKESVPASPEPPPGEGSPPAG